MNPNIQPIQFSEIERTPTTLASAIGPLLDVDAYLEVVFVDPETLRGSEHIPPSQWDPVFQDIKRFYFEGRSPVDLRAHIEKTHGIDFTPRFYYEKIFGQAWGFIPLGWTEEDIEYSLTAEEKLRFQLYPLAGHLELDAAKKLKERSLWKRLASAMEASDFAAIRMGWLAAPLSCVKEFYPEFESEDLSKEELWQFLLTLYLNGGDTPGVDPSKK